jgi:hypothetical protein
MLGAKSSGGSIDEIGSAKRCWPPSRTMLRFITVPPKTPNDLLQVIRRHFCRSGIKAESERMLQFQPLTFVGEEAERVNAAVFRSATGPPHEIVRKWRNTKSYRRFAFFPPD